MRMQEVVSHLCGEVESKGFEVIVVGRWVAYLTFMDYFKIMP